MFASRSSNAILMFHRVTIPDGHGLRFHQHLKVTPEYFEKLLRKFLSLGYAFISMDELVDALNARKRLKKVLSVTFDDGFSDNFTNALPILKDLNIPAIVYVATGLVTKDCKSIWERMEAFLVTHDELFLGDGIKISITTKSRKEECFLALRDLLLISRNQYTTFDALFREYLEEHNIGNLGETTVGDIGEEDRMMTVDELKAWANEPLCSVGCHTHAHINCSDFFSNYVQNDINHSLDMLRNKWGLKVSHFAYPYGEPVAVPKAETNTFWQEHGIYSSVTTEARFIDSGTTANVYSLPRFMVNMFNQRDIVDEFRMLNRSAIKKAILRLLNPLGW